MFPLAKNNIKINKSETHFLSSYEHETEIPELPHPGAFSKKRKHHQHEGVDLYCENTDEVYNKKKRIIIGIFPFTGEIANSPWWNYTYCMLVRCENFVFNYGEIIPSQYVNVGDIVEEGDVLGWVVPVLKKNKGRPMTMLHLEMYEKNILIPTSSWKLNEEKHEGLLDPTMYLKKLAKIV